MSLRVRIVTAVLLLSLANAAAPPPFSCDASHPSTKAFTFCDPALPARKRAADLVSRLTLDEKISQLVNSAPAVPRLGVPAYEWWSEALHGVADVGLGIHFNGTVQAATSFPQVILTAASFDAKLWFRIAQAIGTEARAVYNQGQARGMTFWAPNINIFRDPRWGRGQETPGEDPLTVGKYAVSYVRGIQGDSFEGGKLLGAKAHHLQASACCKHFTAYDLEKWNGTNRFIFDAIVTAQDMADTFQPPFEMCVKQGRASGIMCAYNRVNGVPNCADHNLLTKTVRSLWGFQGYITSDCDAVSIIHDVQGYAKSPEDAVADVLQAGMDVNCGHYLQNYTKSAVQAKKVAQSEINRALTNLFSVRMRLGLFDGNPDKQLYGSIAPSQVCSEEHHKLALAAALNGIVLLKNSQRRLPLQRTSMLVVVGPNAKNVTTLLGNYYGPPCRNKTALKAMYMYSALTKYHPGCNDGVQCANASIGKAVELAREAEDVVLIMGLDQSQEREGHDREYLVLPGKQQSLITEVATVAKKPVVLVLLCGGPVDVSFAQKNPKVGGILWAGYPGEAGGDALAQILFGDHNPGGRLPVTWYPKEFIKVPMTDMRMRPDLAGYMGRTYRFYEGKVVYKFGYGLSYSNYSYNLLLNTQEKLYWNLSSKAKVIQKANSARYKLVSEMKGNICEEKLSVSVEVKNHGEMAGKHPVLLFLGQMKLRNGNPMKQLVAFESVSLNAQETAAVKFALNPCDHLSRATEDGLMVVEEGPYFLAVGDDQYPINVVF